MIDTAVQEQQLAPDFILLATRSEQVVKNDQMQLSEPCDHAFVLYFYPKGDTPGCMVEIAN
jgi:peroxiredoxin